MWFSRYRGPNRPPTCQSPLVDVAPSDELGGIAVGERRRRRGQFERLFDPDQLARRVLRLRSRLTARARVLGVDDGRRALYLRRFGAAQATLIPDTDRARAILLTRRRWVGFWPTPSCVASRSGGPARTSPPRPSRLVQAGRRRPHRVRSSLRRSLGGGCSGGTPTQIVALDESRGELLSRFRTFFRCRRGDAHDYALPFPRSDEPKSTSTPRRSGIARKLVDGGADARYTPSGHMVLVREAVLVAAPFDLPRSKSPAHPLPCLEK